MEEKVGELWHKLITRLAQDRYPQAAVRLSEVNQTLAIVFRALGGDGGLRIESASSMEHHARRSWLQKLAGSATKAELAWRDEQSLRLPETIDIFPDMALNRELYFWLAGLASGDKEAEGSATWIRKNQALTQQTLARYPGMASRYRRLLRAHLSQRPDLEGMKPDEAAQESAIRQALESPGSVDRLPPASHAPWPVPLWMHPSPPGMESGGSASGESGAAANGQTKKVEDERNRRAERTKMPESNRGLITIRMENILTWGEFAKVDRGAEENDDLDQATDAAQQMDNFNITREGESVASKLRFDLDLPSADCDDEILTEGGIEGKGRFFSI